MALGNKKMNVMINAGIWLLLGVFIILVQPMTWGVKVPAVFIIKQTIHFLMLISIYYFNAHYVVPRTLLKNRVGLFVVWLISILALILMLNDFIESYLHVFEAMVKALGKVHEGAPHKPRNIDWFIAMSTLLTLGISTTVASFTRWQRDALLRQELEKEKVKSELSFLKAQINPHFFFNTLNNIYSLSFIDVPGSQDALLKLSRMMRYLLYETQNDTTLLSKEVSFVRDYIQLMKLRMQESTQIIFHEPENYTDVAIAPMILLPYIENAFKHGISATGDNWISIDILFDNNTLHLMVRNKIYRNNNSEKNFQESSGIGLQNTSRRLALLYPGKFNLDIKEEEPDSIYSVQLKLELK